MCFRGVRVALVGRLLEETHHQTLDGARHVGRAIAERRRRVATNSLRCEHFTQTYRQQSDAGWLWNRGGEPDDFVRLGREKRVGGGRGGENVVNVKVRASMLLVPAATT